MGLEQDLLHNFGDPGSTAKFNTELKASKLGWGVFTRDNNPQDDQVRVAEIKNIVVNGKAFNTDNIVVDGTIVTAVDASGQATVNILNLVGGVYPTDVILFHAKNNGGAMEFDYLSANALDFTPGDPSTYPGDIYYLAEITLTAAMLGIYQGIITDVRQRSISPAIQPVEWNTNLLYDLNNNAVVPTGNGNLEAFELGDFIVHIDRNRVTFRDNATYDIVHQSVAGANESIISAYAYNDEVYVLAESPIIGPGGSFVYKVDLNGTIVTIGDAINIAVGLTAQRIMVKASGVYITGVTGASGPFGSNPKAYIMRLDINTFAPLQSLVLNVPEIFVPTNASSYAHSVFEDSQGKVGTIWAETQRASVSTFNRRQMFVRFDDDLTILAETVYFETNDQSQPAFPQPANYWGTPVHVGNRAFALGNTTSAFQNTLGYMTASQTSTRVLIELDPLNDYQIINWRHKDSGDFPVIHFNADTTGVYILGNSAFNYGVFNNGDTIIKMDLNTLEIVGVRQLFNDSPSPSESIVHAQGIGMSSTRVYFQSPRWDIVQNDGAAVNEIGMFGEAARPIPFGTTYLSKPDGVTYQDGAIDNATRAMVAPVPSVRISPFDDMAPFVTITPFVSGTVANTYDDFFLMSDVINTLN